MSPVIKRGKSWTVVVELTRDPETGNRRQGWHGGYRTKREALEAEVELKAAKKAGGYVRRSNQTLEDFAAEWLVSIERTIRPATHYSYARNLRHHVVPYIGSVPLSSLDAGVLNTLYARLLEDGSRHHSRPGGLSPRTVAYVHTIIHRLLRDAVRWGRLARNVADAADPPRTRANSRRAAMRTWTASELGRFLGAVSDDPLYPAFLLLATTGMRRGEALGLRWSDVDLDAGRAAIRQTVGVIAHRVVFGEPKTGKARRVISLDTRTAAALRAQRQRQLEQRLLVGAGWQDRDLVFTRFAGEPLHPEHFSQAFERRVKRHKLPRLSVHGLRHTWATLALEGGVHPKIVQERLGHVNISLTLDTYSHAVAGMESDAAEKVAGMVFGADG
jgi:integrase